MTDKQVFELKIYNTINGLDEESRSKFKALALISDDLAKVSEDHDEETRQVEIDFEKKFNPIYELRSKIIQGEPVEIDVAEYDTRFGEIKDEKYEKLNLDLPSLTHLDGVEGVPDFWLTAMLNHSTLGLNIKDCDKPILKNLINIESHLHPNSQDFSIKFFFKQNDFFSNEVINKRFIVPRTSEKAQRVETTEINWNAGQKPSDTDSFMINFFKDKKEPEEDEEEEDEEVIELDEDYDLSMELKDDLITLALEYYLNLMDHPETEAQGQMIAV